MDPLTAFLIVFVVFSWFAILILFFLVHVLREQVETLMEAQDVKDGPLVPGAVRLPRSERTDTRESHAVIDEQHRTVSIDTPVTAPTPIRRGRHSIKEN